MIFGTHKDVRTWSKKCYDSDMKLNCKLYLNQLFVRFIIIIISDCFLMFQRLIAIIHNVNSNPHGVAFSVFGNLFHFRIFHQLCRSVTWSLCASFMSE